MSVNTIMLANSIFSTCPGMISGAISSQAIHQLFDDFYIYKPKFLDDVLKRITNFEAAFVYLKESTHNHLRPYHYKWETLVWILLHNAQDEDKGGTRIYKRLKELQEEGYEDGQFLKDMQKHVSDEKRHARLFMSATKIAIQASNMEIIDNPDPKVGEEIVEDLLTHVPMPLFKMIGAIFAVEFRSYIMIRNTMKHFAEASEKSKVMGEIFKEIESIPPDEKFHVEYTAKFLEKELENNPEQYQRLIDELVESFYHTGNEMCSHMKNHEQSINEEGGIEILTSIFAENVCL